MGNILTGSHEGHWVVDPPGSSPGLPQGPIWENHANSTCGKGIREQCCIGAISNGGMQGWRGHCVLEDQQLKYQWETNEYIYTHDDLGGEPHHVVFLGDSVMNQMFDSMMCYIDPSDRIPVIEQRNRTGSWRYGIKSNITIDMTDKLKFTMLKSYRQREGDDSISRVCADPTVNALVYNIGLHYNKRGNEPDMLVNNTRWFAREFLEHCRGVNLVIRETTPQHFNNSDSGEWRKKQTDCVPIKKETRWRHELLVGTLGKEYPQLNFTVVPVWDVMRDRYDLHMGRECTHYCYTPSLWNPIINRVIGAILGK